MSGVDSGFSGSWTTNHRVSEIFQSFMGDWRLRQVNPNHHLLAGHLPLGQHHFLTFHFTPTKSSLTEGHPYYDAAPADDAYAGGLNLPLNTYTIPVIWVTIQCDKNSTSSALPSSSYSTKGFSDKREEQARGLFVPHHLLIIYEPADYLYYNPSCSYHLWTIIINH